VVNIDKYSC